MISLSYFDVCWEVTLKADFFFIQISSESSIICWKDYLFQLSYLGIIVKNKLVIESGSLLWTLTLVHWSVYPHINTIQAGSWFGLHLPKNSCSSHLLSNNCFRVYSSPQSTWTLPSDRSFRPTKNSRAEKKMCGSGSTLWSNSHASESW